MNYKVFLGESVALKRRWVVQAHNLEDATGRVVSFCKALLSELETKHPDQDVNIDLKFIELEDNVVEL